MNSGEFLDFFWKAYKCICLIFVKLVLYSYLSALWNYGIKIDTANIFSFNITRGITDYASHYISWTAPAQHDVASSRVSPTPFDPSGQNPWYYSTEQLVDRNWNITNNNNNPPPGSCYNYLPSSKYPSPSFPALPANASNPLDCLPPYYNHPQFYPDTQHSVLQPSLVPVGDQLYAVSGHTQPSQLQGNLQQQPRPYR